MTALLPQQAGIPLPRETAVSAEFWEGCRLEELRFQQCMTCEAKLFEPTTICRQCLGVVLVWRRSVGTGTLYSWSIVWRPQTTAFTVPYAPVIVDLDDGFRMLSNLVGCEHDELSLGMPVKVTFHDVGSGILFPYFEPAGR